MILPGVSPIIRVGDSFDAEFTVRNASEQRIRGDREREDRRPPTQPPPQKLEPRARATGKSMSWNVAVPMGRRRAALPRRCGSIAGGPSDHLKITQRVLPAVPVQDLPGDADALEKPLAEPVACPPTRSRARATWQVALASFADRGARRRAQTWMRAYPYTCLEQRVSRAVALDDPELWNGDRRRAAVVRRRRRAAEVFSR